MVTDAQVEAAFSAEAEQKRLHEFDIFNRVEGTRHAMMRAILEAADAAAWQPIDTAPKDRRMLWFSTNMPGRVFFRYGVVNPPHPLDTMPPTHWRDLPDPPWPPPQSKKPADP